MAFQATRWSSALASAAPGECRLPTEAGAARRQSCCAEDPCRNSVRSLSRPRPAERQNQKTLLFLPFGTRGTIRIFLRFAPAVLSASIWTKNLLKTLCLPSVFFPFFDVFHAFFVVYCHLPTRSANGVAQIHHVCPVVFGQLAVIVDCCCLVVICGHLGARQGSFDGSGCCLVAICGNWGSSGAECHLGLVWGHLMDLVVRAFFCI